MRIIYVGDVHGCYAELMALVDKLQLRDGDILVLLGDLVDRGPNPAEVIEFAQKRCLVILGNHDAGALKRRLKDLGGLSPHHRTTVEKLNQQHWNYLDTLPTYLEFPDVNAVAVHAGVVPEVPMSQQKDYLLMHCQYIRPPEARGRSYWKATGETWSASEKYPPEARFWTEFYEKEWRRRTTPQRIETRLGPIGQYTDSAPPRVFFGHTVLTKAYVTPWAVGLDTGCCFGGELTAYVLPDNELVSVKAERVYFPPRTKRVTIAPGIEILT